MPETNKKYPAIAAALSWNEEPESEEGLFLQPEEATSINTSLQTAAENATALDTAKADVTRLTSELATAKTEKEAAEKKLTDKEEENKKLQDKVTQLGAESSGKGTVLKSKKDDIAGDKKEIAFHESDANPANAWIDKQLAKQSKTPTVFK